MGLFASTGLGQWLAANEEDAYSYLPSSVSQFPQDEEMADKMRAAGLENIQYYPLTFGVATLYVGQKPAVANVEDAPSAEPSAACLDKA